jgi:hypothetical protein
MKKSILFLLMLTIATFLQAQTVVFHESFDPPSNADSVTVGGTLYNFAINSRLHTTGTQCDSAFVMTNDTTFMTTDSFSTVGMSSVFLSFSHICKIELLDAAEVQVSVNNGPWTNLTGTEYINPGNSQFVSNGNKFTSNTYPLDWMPTQNTANPYQSWWKNETFNIGALVGNQQNVKVRFALRDGNGNGRNSNAGWYIDDIEITNSYVPSGQCQAYFTYYFTPTGGTLLHLQDASYNIDSTQINITSYTWTATFGGVVHTYYTPDTTIQLSGYTGYVPVCLTITSTYLLQTCQSTYCDSIYLNTPPPDTCVASFLYLIDTLQNTIAFMDNSYTNNGSINSISWVIYANGILLFSSTMQNPVFNYSGMGWYHGWYNAELTITTDSGCISNNFAVIYLHDTNISNYCQLIVSSSINHVSVINGNDGSIDLTVSGGIPPYNYLWNTGDTTQDISGLPVGGYYVTISTTSTCPSYWYYYNILQPYDSGNIIVDTLSSGIIDTCLNVVPDSFYIASINVLGNSVIVEWVFTSGVLSDTLSITYTFSSFGSQLVYLTIDCNGAKDLTTFMSYIYISQAFNIPENNADDQIKLYPNPVSDILNITFGELCRKPIVVKIFSDIGQQVLFRIFGAYTKQLQINVSDLSSGFYFVQIDLGDGKPVIKKLIK